MSNTVTGTVAHVEKKDWKNNLFFYHIKLEGSPQVYNCGTNDPVVEVGEHLEFSMVNRQVDVKTITRVSEEVAKAASPKSEPATTSTPTSTASTTSSPVGDVAQRIRRQQARHDAVLLVTTAMETDLLPYPKSGKAIDKWQRMLDLIDETTTDLLTQEEQQWNSQSA